MQIRSALKSYPLGASLIFTNELTLITQSPSEVSWLRVKTSDTLYTASDLWMDWDWIGLDFFVPLFQKQLKKKKHKRNSLLRLNHTIVRNYCVIVI